jgi:3-methyladenine DNA glycosylase AlkD
MRTAREVVAVLVARGNARDAVFAQRFFKTGPGEYGEGDVFLGLRVPTLRALVREGDAIPETEIVKLLQRPEHEARLMALLLLVRRFQRGSPADRRRLYGLYLRQRRWINNWDLVDCSAEHIVGGHLIDRSRAPLNTLARSRRLWDRRIAIIATFHFIRRGDFSSTLQLADRLLEDPEDLMHKAIGWMLREVGKRDQAALEAFLKPRLARMPRTMLRYAIERFPEPLRRAYLLGGLGAASPSRRWSARLSRATSSGSAHA